MGDLARKTTLVVGASRGLGHGIATAFAAAGGAVVAVSRSAAAFTGPTIRSELADAADATVPRSLIARHDPEVVVLVAGATPHMRALQHQTWETFSVNCQSDAAIVEACVRADRRWAAEAAPTGWFRSRHRRCLN